MFENMVEEITMSSGQTSSLQVGSDDDELDCERIQAVVIRHLQNTA
jgi:hypothetical protein